MTKMLRMFKKSYWIFFGLFLVGCSSNEIIVLKTKPVDFKPVVAISVCWLEHQGKVLYLKKTPTSKYAPNLWSPAGGKVDNGENPNDAAIRELKEETGITVKKRDAVPLAVLFVRKPDHDFTYHMFEVKLRDVPKVILSKEHDAYAWLSDSEIAKKQMMLGVSETLKIYRELQNKLD